VQDLKNTGPIYIERLEHIYMIKSIYSNFVHLTYPHQAFLFNALRNSMLADERSGRRGLCQDSSPRLEMELQ